MTWFKVDDKLHDHRKARKAGKSAMGVWVLAGSWAMDNETDGFIPDDVLMRWGTRSDAARLVSAGLWDKAVHEGEEGWRFHDWSMFQPSAAVTAAKRAKEHEGAVRGNHKRWHVDRKITDPECEYCYRVPDQEPDRHPEGSPESGGESGANPPVPVPEPDPDGFGLSSAAAPATGKPAASTRKKPATRLPDDWKPTDQHWEKRHDSLDIAHEAEKFRLHAEANDRRQVSWNAAFSQWLMNARPTQRPTTRPAASLVAVPEDHERPPDGMTPDEWVEWDHDRRQRAAEHRERLMRERGLA